MSEGSTLDTSRATRRCPNAARSNPSPEWNCGGHAVADRVRDRVDGLLAEAAGGRGDGSPHLPARDRARRADASRLHRNDGLEETACGSAIVHRGHGARTRVRRALLPRALLLGARLAPPRTYFFLRSS